MTEWQCTGLENQGPKGLAGFYPVPNRRDAREDDWGGFENHYTRKGIGGSNPPPAVNFGAGQVLPPP